MSQIMGSLALNSRYDKKQKPNRILNAPTEQNFTNYHIDSRSPTESRPRFLSVRHNAVLEQLEDRGRRGSPATRSIVGMEYWNG
jgi:hypothetical protein